MDWNKIDSDVIASLIVKRARETVEDKMSEQQEAWLFEYARLASIQWALIEMVLNGSVKISTVNGPGRRDVLFAPHDESKL